MKRFLCGFALGVLAAVFSGWLFFHDDAAKQRFECSRQKLMLVAANAALSIDADTLAKVPLRRDGDKSPEYKIMARQLEAIKKANPFIQYAYIMAATQEPGILQYVVDADPLPKIITAKSPSAFPGDRFDAKNLPQMLAAYQGPSADQKPITDNWGTTLSGYAPIRNASGKTIAIFCVDIDAADHHGVKPS